MKPTQKDLIDTDGENRAVRAFLLGREVGCKDYEQMRRHMTNSGFNNCWPSEFASLGGHMSKAAQQMWLRHLFALERFGAGGGEPFGYFCDWGDHDGLQRIAMYYGEPGSATFDDWNEYPKVHKNLPLYTHPSPTDLRAEYLRGLEDAKKACESWANQHSSASGGCTHVDCDFMAAALDCAEAIEALKGKQ